MSIFVDNDVILDVLLQREAFPHSQEIFIKIETKEIEAYTSPVIFTNSYYLVSKFKSNKVAWKALHKLRLLFKIATINQRIVDLALASSFKDFEDALQYYAALEHSCSYLLTRNKSDYVEEGIPILSPLEYLAIS